MWHLRPVQPADVTVMASELGITQTTARLLWLRGLRTVADARAFWEGRDDLSWLSRPLPSQALERAATRLKAAIAQGETIALYGDYDADGVTATALLHRYLTHGHNARVEPVLPDRTTDGYGLHPAAVRRLAAAGVRVIVTCDNGVSAQAAAEEALSCGIDLIVTDHHRTPEVLPPAFALVHPALEFPHLADLSGAGVALLLVIALEGGWHERLRPMLDLVAIGAIADVVPLNGPNRSLVWAGLRHMRESERLRPGLRALVEAAGSLSLDTLSARDVGFQLAPLLNAAGRLGRSRLAFDLLVAEDLAEARSLAATLATLNQERRELDHALFARLVEDVERDAPHTSDDCVVLADRDFHAGLTGIAAGRLKERLGRPVLLLAEGADGLWKGSGRSPDGVSLYDALASAADLLEGFGGHAQAAGCTVKREHIDALRARLNTFVAACAPDAAPEAVAVDARPTLAELGPAFFAELERLEPTGRGNPAPVLGLMSVRVLATRTDRSGQHLFMHVDDGEAIRELVAWGQADQAATLGDWADVVVRPSLRRVRGAARTELIAERLRPSGPAHEAIGLVPREADGCGQGPRVLDLRHTPHRLSALGALLARGGSFAVYTGERLPGLELDRVVGDREVAYWSDLAGAGGRARALALWARPSDLAAWRALAERADEMIYLMWETPVVEPMLSPDWLVAFRRELAAQAHLPYPALLARGWGSTTLMVRAALGILREAGLLTVDGDAWQLSSFTADELALDGLSTWQDYREAHAFRLLLANGSTEAVLGTLASESSKVLA